MPDGKNLMWLAVGILIGFVVLPHLMGSMKKPAAQGAGY